MRIGDIDVLPLSDGTFVARPEYFTTRVPETPGHPFDADGVAWLPIGCFLIRTGDRVILVDAGLGPVRQTLPHDMELVGGQLPVALRTSGVSAADITDVICTHLHADHVGWLFDRDGNATFPTANIWFGAGDGHHFVDGPGEMFDHIRQGFRNGSVALRALDHDHVVTAGVEIVRTPGHTPGHCAVIISSGLDRAMLVGDAITCPVQLTEPTWRSMGDVDPPLADRTREELWRELEDEHTIGTGAHFPELQFGRVLTGQGRTWST
ncbi:MBL fold metallo-hydrolase [Phytoactinopolyspora endophytica]|uniref:MBL fold metallo-hydrolase n=1 Tax=Phytoactinopolyspora endophytica TaxID=1642495 RepID=UPI00101BF164|nr:MBL fold metallo-hydrolase [Phytoactinopolyspora endophytica]